MTFLDKFQLLKKSIPVPAVIEFNTENCEFIDYTYQSKNCYLCFDSFNLENSIYCISCLGKNLVDCRLTVYSEVCYECVESNRCYGSTYLLQCNDCRDCHFCSLCISSSYCFGCVGLTHKQYCIFNKQYSKKEYDKKVVELKKENPEKILQKMLELKKTIPHPSSQQFNTENCPYGDQILDSKNSYWCFSGFGIQDSGFIFEAGLIKNCWDMFTSGSDKGTTELCYELVETTYNYNCAYLFHCDNSTNCNYSSYLRNCSDCFGCVGLSNKKYCILNNQLTKEKYEEVLVNIKKELGWRA